MQFWYGINIHNSVIWLNWDMFGSKIMIYIKVESVVEILIFGT